MKCTQIISCPGSILVWLPFIFSARNLGNVSLGDGKLRVGLIGAPLKLGQVIFYTYSIPHYKILTYLKNLPILTNIAY